MPKPNKYRQKPTGFEITPIYRPEKVNYGQWVYRDEFEALLKHPKEKCNPDDWLLATHCIEAIDAAEQSMPGHEFAVSSIDENGIHVTCIILTKAKQ